MELQRSKAAVLTQVCLWLGGSVVKNPPANASRFDLGWEDQLEKEMATHFSIPAWEISWTEEPGRLYSPWGLKESETTTHTCVHINVVLILNFVGISYGVICMDDFGEH